MQYILNISDFNEIVNGIKAMKADLVMVSGNVLVGTDNNCTIIKHYKMNTTIPVDKFVIITKTLSTEFYNNITDVNIVIDLDINKIYCPNNISYVDDKPEMIDNSYIWRLDQMCANLVQDMNRSSFNVIGEITSDPNFEIIKSIKAADGATLYIPKDYFNYGMYLYSGALPFVKADKIYLTIHDTGNTFIADFNIVKKKVNDVQVYFKFVKLQR